MKSEEVFFFNDQNRLAGTLYFPDQQPPYPAIVVVHPASGGERTDPFYDHLKTELPDHGFAVLVYDRRGTGHSQGNSETADFAALAGDVIAAVEFLASRLDIDGSRIGLHGTSQGAWIAPIAAARKPEIACIVAVSACGVTPAVQMDYGVAFHLRQEGFDEPVIEKVLELRGVVNAYFRGEVLREQAAVKLQPYEAEPWFERGYLYTGQELPTDLTQSQWYHQLDYEPLSIWKQVSQPTLFLFAEIDEWVPVAASMENYKAATAHLAGVSLLQLGGTNHLMSLSKEEHILDISPEYLSILLDWLRKRLNSRN